jgi:hypothetical protein
MGHDRLSPSGFDGRTLAGILSRPQGCDRDTRLGAIHDCALFLQSQKLGFAVLTANSADIDLLLQLVLAGRALLYRPCA